MIAASAWGERVIWRERTGWKVYSRFEELARLLKERYGARLVDLAPTPESLHALYGDSAAAHFYVQRAREWLRENK